MSSSNQITIICEYRAENGTNEYVFKPYNQYVYTDITTELVSCMSCYDEERIPQRYFVVEVNDIEYNIPEWAAIIDHIVREDWQKDANAYFRHKSIHPKDWKKEYKALTGIDIVAGEKRDVNGMAIHRLANAQKKEIGVNEGNNGVKETQEEE